MNKLLEMRLATVQDVHPPVVCIHGAQTEFCLRQTLTNIKEDQQAEADAIKARALARNSDDSED